MYTFGNKFFWLMFSGIHMYVNLLISQGVYQPNVEPRACQHVYEPFAGIDILIETMLRYLNHSASVHEVLHSTRQGYH